MTIAIIELENSINIHSFLDDDHDDPYPRPFTEFWSTSWDDRRGIQGMRMSCVLQSQLIILQSGGFANNLSNRHFNRDRCVSRNSYHILQ